MPLPCPPAKVSLIRRMTFWHSRKYHKIRYLETGRLPRGVSSSDSPPEAPLLVSKGLLLRIQFPVGGTFDPGVLNFKWTYTQT